MNTNNIRAILASLLLRVKVKNPLLFLAIIAVGNFTVYSINHADVLYFLTNIDLQTIDSGGAKILYGFRDFVGVGMSLISAATFNDLANTHPAKVKALGQLEGEQEFL